MLRWGDLMSELAAIPIPGPGQVVSLKVRVSARDLDSFIERYSRYIDGDRIFIFTKAAQKVGSRVRFSLVLASGEPLIDGEGTVTRVQSEAGDASHPPGMELRFVPLDDRSQTLVDFLLATRATNDGGAPTLKKPAPPPLPLRPPVAEVASAPTLMVAPSEAPAAAPSPSLVPDAPSPEPAAAPSLAPAGAPAPAFAESWDERQRSLTPLPGTVPANPFGEVPNHAIEYFVEWSIEQAIGARTEPTSHFSNVLMAAPKAGDAFGGPQSPSRRRAAILIAVGVAAGVPLGATVMWATRKSSALPPVVARAPEAPPVETPTPPVETPTPPAARAPTAAERAPTAAAEAPAAEAPAEASARVTIVSHPPRATVTVDDKLRGTTPLELSLTRGPHQVTLARERYMATTATVKAPGQLKVNLRRPLATLLVSSSAPGASVVVLGNASGSAPLKVQLPEFETYQIEVSSANAGVWRKKVYLRAPSTVVQASLLPPRRTSR
jgi:hypothetical protein